MRHIYHNISITSFLWISFSVSATSPAPTAAQSLLSYGLPIDAPTVLECLENGIDAWRGESQSNIGLTPHQLNQYKWMIARLATVGLDSAEPLLADFVSGDFPTHLEREFWAASLVPSISEEMWHARTLAEKLHFRTQCAWILAQLGATSSLPVLEAYLLELEAYIPSQLVDVEVNSQLPDFNFTYGRLCLALTALGSTKGISSLIQWLPLVDPNTQMNYEHWLTRCTGTSLGLSLSPTRQNATESVKSWQMWWEESVDTFNPDKEKVLHGQNQLIVNRPAWPKLRDYFLAAADFEGASDWQLAAMRWLETNACRKLDELRSIAEDPQEAIRIRWSALYWFSTCSPPDAQDVYTRIALADPSEYHRGKYQSLVLLALSKLSEESSELARSIAIELAFSTSENSPVGVGRLNGVRDTELLVDNYHRLSEDGRSRALSILSHLPNGAVAVKDSLDKERYDQAVAACVAVHRFDFLPLLSPKERTTFDKWMNDSNIRWQVTASIEDTEALFALAKETQGSTLQSARVYALYINACESGSSMPRDLLPEYRLRLFSYVESGRTDQLAAN